MPSNEHQIIYEKIGPVSLDRITEINFRLDLISELIKLNQPRKPGAITLHLYGCGKDCLGCPHPKWLVWHSVEKGEEPVFLGYTIKNPSRHVKRSGPFKENAHKIKALIEEASKLLSERSAIIKLVSNLNRKLLRCRSFYET